METQLTLQNLSEVESDYRYDFLQKIVAQLSGTSLSITALRTIVSPFVDLALPHLDSWNQGKIKSKVETFINSVINNQSVLDLEFEKKDGTVWMNKRNINLIISDFIRHVTTKVKD